MSQLREKEKWVAEAVAERRVAWEKNGSEQQKLIMISKLPRRVLVL